MGSTSGMLQDTIGKLNLMLQTGTKNFQDCELASAPFFLERLLSDADPLMCSTVIGGSKHMCYLIVFVVFAFIVIAWIMKNKTQ